MGSLKGSIALKFLSFYSSLYIISILFGIKLLNISRRSAIIFQLLSDFKSIQLVLYFFIVDHLLLHILNDID